ncbi:MAG: hypothetical protein ACAI44_09025, partial [Candidatus Sericytochromatia bacterium]
ANLASVCQESLQPERALQHKRRVLEILDGLGERRDAVRTRDALRAFADYLFSCTTQLPFATVAAEISRLGGRYWPQPEQIRQALPVAPGRRIRLGYLSADFSRHTVMALLEPLFTHSDPERFEIFCYANAGKRDDVTAWLEAHTRFRYIHKLSDKQAHFLIRNDQLDLLVDLSGFGCGHRLALLARKPAPRLATGLGFLFPTGCPAVDYALLDAQVFSDTDAARVPETFVRIPGNLYYRPDPELPLAGPQRAAGTLVFGSANSLFKLNGPVLDCWAEILHQLPEAILKLKARALSDPQVMDQARACFSARGIDPGRLVLSGQSLRREVMEWYHGVDICLDPFPYQGGVTSCEALYMGCPVISLAAGGSNTSISVLRASGLDKYITATPADYIRAAVQLGQTLAAWELQQRLDLRHLIRERIRGSRIFDPVGFVAGIEQAYEFIVSQPAKSHSMPG